MYICAFMLQVAINLFFFVEYLPDDSRKWPKHIGGLPNVCISLFIIIMLLIYIFIYIYVARNMDNFKFVVIFFSQFHLGTLQTSSFFSEDVLKLKLPTFIIEFKFYSPNPFPLIQLTVWFCGLRHVI